jgi:hypothetical protein
MPPNGVKPPGLMPVPGVDGLYMLEPLTGEFETFALSNLCQTPSSRSPRLVLYVSIMLNIICGFCSCSFSSIPLSERILCQSLGRPYVVISYCAEQTGT